jgi:hypothetical protein
MEEYLKQIGQTAKEDQGLRHTAAFAHQLWVFYEEAVRSGFTEDQALQLTLELQRGFIANANDPKRGASQ